MTAHGRKQGRSHVQDNLTADAAAGRRVLSPGSLPCAVDGQRPGRAGSGAGRQRPAGTALCVTAGDAVHRGSGRGGCRDGGVGELSPWSLPSCSVSSTISLLPAFTQVAAAAVRGQGDRDSDPAPPGSAGTCLLTETATRTSRSGCAWMSTRCGREQTLTAIRTTGHDTTAKIQSLLFRTLPHLKSPDAATAAARTPSQSQAIISTHRFPASIFSQCLIQGESHARCSLLPRTPCPRLDLGPFTPQPRAASAQRAADASTADIPGQPGGLLACQRIAIARFGADVAAAGGIGPALAAGLEPAGLPGRARRRTPSLGTRPGLPGAMTSQYQELYQAQVAELHLLMATAPGCSLPLSHRRPPTDPLTNIHTGYISLISDAARRSDAYDPPVMHIGGSSRGWLGPGSVTKRETIAGSAAVRRSPVSSLAGLPFLAQQGVEQVIGPLALGPGALPQVAFAPHAAVPAVPPRPYSAGRSTLIRCSPRPNR